MILDVEHQHENSSKVMCVLIVKVERKNNALIVLTVHAIRFVLYYKNYFWKRVSVRQRRNTRRLVSTRHALSVTQRIYFDVVKTITRHRYTVLVANKTTGSKR